MHQSELYRVATFSSCSTPCSVSPLTLAKHGFFYMETSDSVACFECKTHLKGWSSYDNLQEMHKQKSPQCPLVNGNASTNEPLKMMNLPGIGDSIAGKGDIETDFANHDLGRDNTANSDHMLGIYTAAYKRANSKGVFSSSTDCEIYRSKPDYDELRKEEVRLRTFHDWPLGAQADPQVLAREGLFYTGTEDRVDDGDKAVSEDDRQTQRVLEGQLRGEDLREPTRTSARKQVRQIQPANHEDHPKFPDYANVAQRVNSFLRGQVSQLPTAEGLADAGWFWIGPGDKVQCFQCGGNLRDWKPESDPWEEHKRWYTNCSYIKNHFSTPRRQFQEPVHQMVAGPYCIEPREVEARMDTATVRAILNMGYSKDLVRMVIEKRLSTTGDDFPIAESLVEALFQLEEECSQFNDLAGSGLSSF